MLRFFLQVCPLLLMDLCCEVELYQFCYCVAISAHLGRGREGRESEREIVQIRSSPSFVAFRVVNVQIVS